MRSEDKTFSMSFIGRKEFKKVAPGARLVGQLNREPPHFSFGSWKTSVGGRHYRLGSTPSFYINFSDSDQGVCASSIGAES